MSYEEYLNRMKQMIDDLKALTADLGYGNAPEEYKIITELFTYKFLNDKLVYDFDHRENKDETWDKFVRFANRDTPKMKKEHLLDSLFQNQNKNDFHKTFDNALLEVNELNADIYNIKTTTGAKKPLFEPLSAYIRDEGKELELAKRAINILAGHEFKNIYDGGFDYFSTVFEYLLKDFNNDSGSVYAEYFTPLFAGEIMADILVNDEEVRNVTVYDPAAGSGTLLLALANKIGVSNCSIYSQDRSQKSTQFLRINLILNRLAHSLHNVVEGNTLTNPEHKEDENNVMKFDYVVSNPPFKLDFSSFVNTLKEDPFGRFFAGLPNIPNKDKKGMAIYETFIQHIVSSLSDRGKAAIVVPTGFVSTATGIPLKIRKQLIDSNWLKGVIHMPSNIFATTGTSVSIVFIDKTKSDDMIFLMDASNLGEKKKLDEGQRTILSTEDITKIKSYFKQRIEEVEFSVLVNNEDVKENNYSIQAGNYVELKDEVLDNDIDIKLNDLSKKIISLLENSIEEADTIISLLKEV